jgi:hypothetical protein
LLITRRLSELLLGVLTDVLFGWPAGPCDEVGFVCVPKVHWLRNVRKLFESSLLQTDTYCYAELEISLSKGSEMSSEREAVCRGTYVTR